MKIAYGRTKSARWAKVFETSIENAGHTPIYIDKYKFQQMFSCDALLMTCYNMKHPQRIRFHKANEKAKLPVVYIDAPVFDSLDFNVKKTYSPESYYSITIDHAKSHGIQYTLDKRNDATRWDKIKDKIEVKDWISLDLTKRSQVTILVHNIGGYKSNVISEEDQISHILDVKKQIVEIYGENNTCTSIHPKYVKAYNASKVERKRRRNTKPLLRELFDSAIKPISIDHIMNNSRFCVGWHSNSLCQATVYGVPTICLDDDCFSYDLSAHNIGDELVTPDRTQWLNQMSWCNWSEKEIKSGRFWEVIEPYLRKGA